MREDVAIVGDGQRLGYAEYGDPAGTPLLELHGVPGSRRYHLDEDALRAARVRLLTVERPGFGLSDRMAGRTLLDWPPLAAAFADALGVGDFAVLGVSAGGPYAMACGCALPDRVRAVGLACSVGPVFDNPQFDELLSPEMQALLPIARQDFDVARALVRDFIKPTVDSVTTDAEAFFDTEFLASWHERDRPRFVALRDDWLVNLRATYANGVDAIVDEIASTFGPWGFSPRDVLQPIRAFHGSIDPTPIELVRFVVESAPNGRLTEYPDEAHYLSESHHPEWIAALTEWAR